MPRTPRPGKRSLYVEIPEKLADLLDKRAKDERRDKTTLVLMALEQFLGVKPEDYEEQAEAPPDAPAPASAPAAPVKGKRRKKGEAGG
jgi:hypothetical protein